MAGTQPAITLTESDIPPVVHRARSQLDAVVLPGIPGSTITADTQTAVPHDHYPSSTTDVIKVLCEADLNIDYADRATHRAEVAQKAADWWLPVIVFLEPAAAHLAGALMAEAILSLLGRRRADHSLLHVKVGKIEKSGTRIEWFEAHGNGHDVLEALKTFGDRHDG